MKHVFSKRTATNVQNTWTVNGIDNALSPTLQQRGGGTGERCIHNTKIYWGFFRTKFRSSDRRHYIPDPVISSGSNPMTTRSKVLPDRITGLQLAINSLHFLEPHVHYHSWTQVTCPYPKQTQSMPSTILICSFHLRLGFPSGPFPEVSPPKPFIHIPCPHTCHMPRLSHSSRFDHPNNIW